MSRVFLAQRKNAFKVRPGKCGRKSETYLGMGGGGIRRLRVEPPLKKAENIQVKAPEFGPDEFWNLLRYAKRLNFKRKRVD